MSVLSRRIFALSVFIAANYFIGIHLRRSKTTGNNSSIIKKTNNDIALQTQIPSKTGSSNSQMMVHLIVVVLKRI